MLYKKKFWQYLKPRYMRRGREVLGRIIILYLHLSAELRLFKKLDKQRRFLISLKDAHPCLGEDTENTGFDRHYIYHPAWAARVLSRTRPEYHIDISSTLNFCSIVSAFIPVKFYDYRPAKLELNDLYCGQADLTALPFRDNEIKSLSCMHTVEHIGLGRYGDKIDPDGDIRAISDLKRVLAPGGSLLFVVPVSGRPRIQFNAHRIYSYRQIVDLFQGLTLKEFSLIPDNSEQGGLVTDASEELANEQGYGCGCFWFIKE